jgi:hypothetical protein
MKIESPISRFSSSPKISFLTSLLSLILIQRETFLKKPPMSSSSSTSSRQLATLPLIILVRSPLNLKLLEYFHLISLFMKLMILASSRLLLLGIQASAVLPKFKVLDIRLAIS